MIRQTRCVVMRGGTSKAVFLKEADLPSDPATRDALILRIFGSPDKRQIDGLGGADPLTSKLAIIGPPRADVPEAAGTHLTYTFAQVEIDEPEIDYLSLCGNISAAVGAFAVREGMVEPRAPVTMVRAWNTNLRRVLRIEVPVLDGQPAEEGDFTIPGVPGTGARILVDFADTAGGGTGALLPTGRPVDRLEVEGLGTIEASLLDIGNPHVFIRARDVGLTGAETPAEIDGRAELLDRLERIRGAAAYRLGLATAPAAARSESPAVPILGMVAPPCAYRDFLRGTTVAADEMDVLARLMFMQRTHKTFAGTSTVCTGVASRVPGTLVHEAGRPAGFHAADCRIGHPAGVIVTEVSVTGGNGPEFRVHRATLGRTARRIMEGYVFTPERLVQHPEAAE
ncbi:2-methylaconitate cis-trans isomerase PrpF family protein [Plastoroseomonas hellenica]|uniref:2-methylaconitate cis-trans isomerase PrpF family protein n=1 Tax=Plastoroseomonas hellenica TaxID=2687306 RepID=UPI001BA6496F|nr:PrpF domain-containing protein [Plastoroseomonas hellenica]MBR0647637.1 3-methylitaconate isomerase [Plastoroseomonas hellenica]